MLYVISFHSNICMSYCAVVKQLYILNTFKGTVAWGGLFAHCLLYRIERKDLKFFPCGANIYWVRGSFNSFSGLENTQSDIFLWDRRKILLYFVLLGGYNIISRLPWLEYWLYEVLISCWKILAHSPNTLNAAKVRPK